MGDLMRNILVTGGAGYIGSHTTLKLLSAGYSVTPLDNLCNSTIAAVGRISKIAGTLVEFIEGDIRDRQVVRRTLTRNKIYSVIYFAGLKAHYCDISILSARTGQARPGEDPQGVPNNLIALHRSVSDRGAA